MLARRKIVDIQVDVTNGRINDGERRLEIKVDITTGQSLFEAGVSLTSLGQLHEERHTKRFTIHFKPAEKTRLAVNLAVWCSLTMGCGIMQPLERPID